MNSLVYKNCMYVITPVQHSDWAAPIVPIMKKDGTLRLYGDYKVTINQALIPDNYPLPKIEDIFAALGGGKLFSKLELSHAYQQIRLDDSNILQLTPIRVVRIFNAYHLEFPHHPISFKELWRTFYRIYLTSVSILMTFSSLVLMKIIISKTWNVCSLNLSSVALTLKRSKCSFAAASVEYLGHIIDSSGLHPSNAKVKAPALTTELRAFLVFSSITTTSFSPIWPQF